MPLAELLRMVPAPADPEFAIGSWPEVEARHGISLPRDFKEIVGVYGAGLLGGLFIVMDPFLDVPGYSYDEHVATILSAYDAVKVEHPQACPYNTRRERDGLFPWGYTENGDVAWWLTSGEAPESWPIALVESRHGSVESHELDVSSFLARWIAGSLESRILRTPGDPVFTRYSDAIS